MDSDPRPQNTLNSGSSDGKINGFVGKRGKPYAIPVVKRGFQIHWEKTDHYPVPVEYVNYYDEDSEVDEEEHVEVVVGSKVKLLQDDLYIGSGVINSLFSEQRQVHNHDMVKDEVVILMKQLEIKTIKHPIYIGNWFIHRMETSRP